MDTADKIACPYVGLVPYGPGDARFFFGRERDQRLIVANLFSSRLTLLYGPSGVGKTSILRAGVLKELQRRIDDSSKNGRPSDLILVYANEWHSDPLVRLNEAIRSGVERAFPGESFAPADSLLETARLMTTRFNADVMIVLDQFEEYFLYHSEDASPEGFPSQFAATVNATGLPVSFLLGLREDSLALLDRFRPLIPNLYGNYYRLARLEFQGARDAIEKPIEEFNTLPTGEKPFSESIAIEPELVDAILAEVRTGRDLVNDGGKGLAAPSAPETVEAPYLQLVLIKVWAWEIRAGSRRLRESTLHTLGGAATIVADHLRSVVGSLTSQERELCAGIFQYMVTPAGTKIAYSQSALADQAGFSSAEVGRLLEKLASGPNRILATIPAAVRGGEAQYEIYHDALTPAVLAWRRAYRTRKLKEEAQSLRQRVFVMSVLSVVAIAAAIWALVETNEARKQSSLREQAEIEARKQSALRGQAEVRAMAAEHSAAERAYELEALFRADDPKTAERLKEKAIEERKNALNLNRSADRFGSTIQVIEKLPQREARAKLIDLDSEILRLSQPSPEQKLESLPPPPASVTSVPLVARRPIPRSMLPSRINPKDELEYLLVPAGNFQMGCSNGDESCASGESPAHNVTIKRPFWLGRTEVTQAAWVKVRQEHQNRFKGDLLPVDSISWDEADDYCRAVGMRLPTEAEWEYAARSGTDGIRYGPLEEVAWSGANAGDATRTVATRKPSEWGFYDMLGNVLEWVNDWFDSAYYKLGVAVDPTGPPKGPGRVIRGGAWYSPGIEIRASSRRRLNPNADYRGAIGFRCASNDWPFSSPPNRAPSFTP